MGALIEVENLREKQVIKLGIQEVDLFVFYNDKALVQVLDDGQELRLDSGVQDEFFVILNLRFVDDVSEEEEENVRNAIVFGVLEEGHALILFNSADEVS